MNYRILFYFLLLISNFCIAQHTKVSGSIFNKNSKEPIPFINIIFKGTNTGTISDTSGIYNLETSQTVDSIIVSGIGFKKQTLFVKKNQSQRIDVLLENDNYNLKEITIKPGRNPAFRILDNVVAHKQENKNNSLNSYQWQVYDKFQIYFGNYSEKFTKKKQFKNYNFIFDYADSVDGKAMLPIYMSESINQQFVSNNLSLNKNILLARKSTGETYEQLTSIANHMVENINIYENYFTILDKSFISPINDNYQLFYKYYLEDIMFIDNQKCYKIRFVPKWKEDFAFSGNVYIHDTTWAIKKIDLKINNEINLNYVKDFFVKQEFSFIDKKWIQKKFETSATISPLKRKQSDEFTVHRTTAYKNIIINNSSVIENNFNAISKSTNDTTTLKNEQYWAIERPDSLNSKEKYNYLIADTINYVPFIKKLKKAVITFASGYLELGKISIGQIHTFYSFNPVEQDRYKFGLKTNKYFSKTLQLEGYLAHGSSDKTTKYKASILYVPQKKDKQFAIGAYYLYDLKQMGISANHIQLDNILTSFTRTSDFSKLTFNKELNIFAEKNWTSGFSTNLNFTNDEIRPLGNFNFEKLVNESGNVIQQIKNITTSEIALNTRLSFHETFYDSEFKRNSMGSNYPIINLKMIFGIKDFMYSEYNYQKIKLNIRGKLRLNPIGYTVYNLEGGKVFGNVPYLLLELHAGNQTLVYDAEAFNLMKYFEFASDEYVSLHLDHHFDGFFLNKIPLLKKAQLREVISARGVVGNLHDNNKREMLLPVGLSDVTKPYIECSVGIENIFKVVRIDYVWRVTQKSIINTDNWSIKAKFYFSF